MKDHKHIWARVTSGSQSSSYCEECGAEKDYTINEMIETNTLDVRPIIAKTMRACGLTYKAIGIRLGMSKQAVEKLVKN